MAIIGLAGIMQHEHEFMLAFGRVLGEWSYIELRAFEIFCHLTDIETGMARAIFFSTRSYNGRADILKVVIQTSKKSDLTKEAALVFLEKANTYNSFRNILAHNMPIAFATEDGGELLLIENKKGMLTSYLEGINIQHLINAYTNFNNLQHNTHIVFGYLQHEEYLERVPKSLERLRMLPNEPRQKVPSRNQAGRQRQRQAARPKEK